MRWRSDGHIIPGRDHRFWEVGQNIGLLSGRVFRQSIFWDTEGLRDLNILLGWQKVPT